MASPQVENGFTRISNELLEAICRTALPGRQLSCILFIIRKTYGFGKKDDSISLSQFCRALGMKKQNVSRDLKILSYRKIIVIKGDDRKVKTYRFNKNYEEWNLSSSTITERNLSSSTITPVIKDDHKLSSSTMTTKEKRNYTKERGGKFPQIPYQAIVDLYNDILPPAGLPMVAKLTSKRRALIKARWNESPKTCDLDWWQRFFKQVAQTGFLIGNNGRGWRADFDWLLKQANFIKIIEGTYAK
jgi:phage replication O-like protein O